MFRCCLGVLVAYHAHVRCLYLAFWLDIFNKGSEEYYSRCPTPLSSLGSKFKPCSVVHSVHIIYPSTSVLPCKHVLLWLSIVTSLRHFSAIVFVIFRKFVNVSHCFSGHFHVYQNPLHWLPTIEVGNLSSAMDNMENEYYYWENMYRLRRCMALYS